MPPPAPVPRMAANTTSAPAAAPSVASDRARQLASLARATGWPMAASMSCCSGWPFRQVELQFFIKPEAVRVPGVPMPMLMLAVGPPAACRAAATTSTSAASVPA